MGTVMYLMALPMNVLLGWNIRWIILATGLSVTIYTFVEELSPSSGRMAIQAVVLMIGALACAAIMLFKLPEGPGQLFTLAAENNKFSLVSFAFDLTTFTFWIVLVYGVVINLQNFGIDQNYVQRYLTAKSDREARKSVWLGGLLYVPLSALFSSVNILSKPDIP